MSKLFSCRKPNLLKIVLLAGVFNLVFFLSFVMFSKTANAELKHGGNDSVPGIDVFLESWDSPTYRQELENGTTITFDSSFTLRPVPAGSYRVHVYYFLARLDEDNNIDDMATLYDYNWAGGVDEATNFDAYAELGLTDPSYFVGVPPGFANACVGFTWEWEDEVGFSYWCELVYVGSGSGQPPEPPQPPQWPDFIAENLATGGVLSPGNLLSFSGRIRNQGPVGLPGLMSNTRLRIDVDNNGSWDITPTNIRIPGLSIPGAGAYFRDVTWANAWRATDGTHKFEICADVNNEVPESDNTNNCTSKEFTVMGPRPDLVPQNLSINGTLEEGENLTFSGQIRNQGNANAGNSTARFRLDVDNNGTWDYWAAPESTHPVGPLAVGGSELVGPSLSWSSATQGNHKFELCADVDSSVRESDEANNCATRTFTVGPAIPKAWIKTEGGDVGAQGNIEVIRDLLFPFDAAPPGLGPYNADYLVIFEGMITNRPFTSAKSWLVGGYTIEPKTIPSSYTELLGEYKPLPWSGSGAIPNGGKNQLTGNLTIGATNQNMGSDPTVLFVSGNLTLSANVTIARPIVFIVGGNITVDAGVTIANGFYIAPNAPAAGPTVGQFSTNGSNPLTVNGGVIANSFSLGRDLGAANQDTPAEQFVYNPGYLWYFRDILGTEHVTFKEVAP